MGTRLDLDQYLRTLTGHVYFQPPRNIQMSYPCIVYKLETPKVFHANNRPYVKKNRYSITYIDKNPESSVPGILEDLPLCSHDQNYVSDNLYHNVFTLYY